MSPSRRKKWSEAEERTLIDKYGEMVCEGTLAKMKTREKKYKPISVYVNSVHHVRDPIAFPWQWSWKDVSTKVQNMRHQYSLVKQKVKKPDSAGEKFDWMEGLTHWSNFLRYKEVFGDLALEYNDSQGVGGSENGRGFDNEMEIAQFEHLGQSGDGDFVGVENEVMGLDFDYGGEDGEVNYDGDNNNNNNNSHLKEAESGFVYEDKDIEPMGSDTRKKRKVVKGLEKKRVWGFVANQLGQLREMETRFEQREVERERQRKKREEIRMESEKEWERKWDQKEKEKEERQKVREKVRRQRIWEWEAMEKESEERERRRQEEEVMHAREWEERMSRRRSEWKTRIDDTLSQHRVEMGQIQSRILDEQQNLTNQLLGIVSQWNGHPTDHATASNHYLSQMMQNLHHVTGIVHDDSRVEGDNQDDQFIVDG